MQNAKYQRLRMDFKTALSDDNLEKCFELLRKDFLLSSDQQNQLSVLEGRFNRVRRERRMNSIDFDKFSMETSQIANSLIGFFSELGEDTVSLAESIHDRILVVACKKTPTDWENLFPAAFFSHVHIMSYGDDVPPAYASPDVVIFDDLDCPGIGNTAQMRMLSREMPSAHLLYVGDNNPFRNGPVEGDAAIFERCANANSKFTLHARLRELLEFRKIYGTP